GGRLCSAAYRASRRRAVSLGAEPLPVRPSATPSEPRAFHRCRTARTATADSPTTPATSAGVRSSSVRASSQRACHRTFSAAGRVPANAAGENDWRAIRDTVARFGADPRVAVEACSGAADLAEELVTKAGWHVDLAHPGYVARMRGNPDETDYSDARMLADLE